MEITGYDNVLTSSKAFNSIINQFEDELKSLWPEMLVDSETIMEKENWFERFYAKNKRMLDEYEIHGFNSNINAQGCLYLISSKKSSLWQYTLVTPESTEKSGFSQKVFTILKDCLTKDSPYFLLPSTNQTTLNQQNESYNRERRESCEYDFRLHLPSLLE